MVSGLYKSQTSQMLQFMQQFLASFFEIFWSFWAFCLGSGPLRGMGGYLWLLVKAKGKVMVALAVSNKICQLPLIKGCL